MIVGCPDKGVELRKGLDRLVQLRIRPRGVQARANHHFRPFIGGQKGARLGQNRVLDLGRRLGKAAGHRAQQVDRRITPAFRDGAVQHHMAVQNPAQDVCYRFLNVRSGHEDREDRGDRAGPDRPGSGPFAKLHDHVRRRRGIAAQGRDFTGGDGDLAMRLGEAGDRISQEDDAAALVAKMLCHGHRRPGAAAAGQRRLVRCGGDDDRPRQPLGPQRFLDELTQLAPAFTDQRNHRHVRFEAFGEMAQKAGFPDAGPGEQSDPLSVHDREEGVEDAHPRLQPPPEGCARTGGRRVPADRPRRRAAGERATVQRHPVWVDHAPDPAVVRGQIDRPQQGHGIADAHPVRHGVGQHQHLVAADLQHLTAQRAMPHPQFQPVAQKGGPAQPADMQHARFGPGDAADLAHRPNGRQL